MFSLLLVLAFIYIEVFQHVLVTRYFRLQIFNVGQQLFARPTLVILFNDFWVSASNFVHRRL